MMSDEGICQWVALFGKTSNLLSYRM